MGENATYVPVYATRVEHRANSRAYYYYGLAMQEERMILVPLSFAEQEVGYGKPFQIRKDQLGKIKTAKKMDATFQLVGLYDKENKLIIEGVKSLEGGLINEQIDSLITLSLLSISNYFIKPIEFIDFNNLNRTFPYFLEALKQIDVQIFERI